MDLLRCVNDLPQVSVCRGFRRPGRSPALSQQPSHIESPAHDSLPRHSCLPRLRLVGVRHSACLAFCWLVTVPASATRCECDGNCARRRIRCRYVVRRQLAAPVHSRAARRYFHKCRASSGFLREKGPQSKPRAFRFRPEERVPHRRRLFPLKWNLFERRDESYTRNIKLVQALVIGNEQVYSEMSCAGQLNCIRVA